MKNYTKIEVGMFVNKNNKEICKKILNEVVNSGIDFKVDQKFLKNVFDKEKKDDLLNIFEDGVEINKLIKSFNDEIMPYCSNFSSEKFMSFPDAGNSLAGLVGAIYADLLQQNMINSSFCAPIATYLEIAVINCLRKVVGYSTHEIKNIWDVGGIITYGGTGSNTTAMMLARENHRKNTMENGVINPDEFITIIPKGIGHYSIRSAFMWLGVGNKVIEVDTKGFKYDLQALKGTLLRYKGKIMCVVAYVGDSRTMTIDNLEEVYNLVKSVDENIWLHADACHGFSLAFSNKLKYKVKGIEKFDSISTDPHKVLDLPYCLSALLVKDPQKFKLITSTSDLIMQEDYAFGQITPFIGSKSWVSLKLWFVLQNLGLNGVAKMIEDRMEMAQKLKQMILEKENLILLNAVEMNSVVFMYAPINIIKNINLLNKVNKEIHDRIYRNGDFHLHQFSLPDNFGVVQQDAVLYPLRYMSGNPNITEKTLEEMLNTVENIGKEVINELSL